ncbi:MAG: hypothetical protein JWQ74_1308 [Marmoricola sp.]|nr:hypothetical protein [Marmoricola sp.]
MGKHTRRLRWSAAAAVAVLVVGGGTAYAVTGTADSPRYRTATAVKGDVEQTLASSGTVDAAHRADLGFGTDGTIASLKVAVGDTVKTGQVLAVLETTDLDAAVTEAKAKVAKAVAQLAADRTAQSAAVEQAVSTPSGQGAGQGQAQGQAQGQGQSQPSGQATQGTTGQPSAGGSSSAATAATLKKLKALQDAVIAAQSRASAALATAASALAAQTAACANAYEQPTAATPSDDPTAGTEDGPDGTDGPGGTDDAAAVSAACSTALSAVQDRQQDVSDAQGALAVALTNLSSALTKALGAVTRASASSTAVAHARTVAVRTVAASTTSGTPTAAGSQSGQAGSSTVTAARLASDQADIEQADADLVTAQQARSQAKLRSTRSGKVAALDAAVGNAVSAGDTVVTVIGGQAVTVLGSVTEAKVGLVKAGQKVRVTVPGKATAADGVVTAIALTADTSSGSTSYPVTVTVEDPTIALPAGSQASLTIVLSTAKDVVTVPLSAITRVGEGAVVRVWDGKALTRKQVTLGATGSRTVAISSGLTAGTEVVLAAIDDPISGASSTLNERGGFAGAPGIGQFRQGGAGGAGGRTTRVTR